MLGAIGREQGLKRSSKNALWFPNAWRRILVELCGSLHVGGALAAVNHYQASVGWMDLLLTRNKDAISNKCIATSNKCLTSSNKDAISSSWPYYWEQDFGTLCEIRSSSNLTTESDRLQPNSDK